MSNNISIFDLLPKDDEMAIRFKRIKSTDWKWTMKEDYPKEKNGLKVFSCFACGGGSTMVYRNTDNFEMRISKDCYKSIVEALEKQIPQTPICSINARKPRLIDGRCPSCNGRQSFGSIEWKKTFNKYCIKCGQALDWSEKGETAND